MKGKMELETINKLYLELSQIATTQTRRELMLLDELKFWFGERHEGECQYTDKADEGCYLCRNAEVLRLPKTKRLIAQMEGFWVEGSWKKAD